MDFELTKEQQDMALLEKARELGFVGAYIPEENGGTGLAQGALEQAIKHISQREQFGQKIASFQAIRFKIAEMAEVVLKYFVFLSDHRSLFTIHLSGARRRAVHYQKGLRD